MDAGLGWPIMHRGRVSNGTLYLLVVPDNFADLYNLPDNALNSIRSTVSKRVVPYTIEGPNNISLYVYDNNTIVVESFHDEEITFNVVAQSTPKNTATDVLTGEKLEGKARMTFSFGPAPAAPAQVTYSVTLKPHSYKALKFE